MSNRHRRACHFAGSAQAGFHARSRDRLTLPARTAGRLCPRSPARLPHQAGAIAVARRSLPKDCPAASLKRWRASGPQKIDTGWRVLSMSFTAVRKLCGQRKGIPRGVNVQSSARICAPEWPPPAKNFSPSACSALITQSSGRGLSSSKSLRLFIAKAQPRLVATSLLPATERHRKFFLLERLRNTVHVRGAGAGPTLAPCTNRDCPVSVARE